MSSARACSSNNKFVSVHHSLTADEQRDIKSLFVKPGKIGGYVRSRERSDVWKYFGELCYKDTSGNTLSIDAQRHYCNPCLVKQQSPAAGIGVGHISQIQSYTLSTATSALCDHLRCRHEIKLSKNNCKDTRLKQSTIKDMLKKSGVGSTSGPAPSQEQLNSDFLVWLALDLEPFSMLNNRGFRYFFGKNFPQLSIPDESTLRKSYVQNVYDSLVDKVKVDLASVNTVNLMFDGWTDKYHAVHFLGLRVQFITEDWTGKVVTLSVKPCAGDSRSVHEHIHKELVQFIGHDYKSKQLFSTHDGASAMKKVSSLLKISDHVHCVAHALHLLLTTDSMSKVPVITALLQKCKKIVTTLHFKTELLESEVMAGNDKLATAELLEKICAAKSVIDKDEQFTYDNGTEDDSDEEAEAVTETSEHNSEEKEESAKKPRPTFKTIHRLQNEIPTRWSSCLHMIQSLLHLRTELTNALKQTGHYNLCLGQCEWEVLKELNSFLQCFAGMTDLVSTRITSLSLIPLVRAEIMDTCAPDTKDSDELKSLKKLVKKNLDKRLPLTDAVTLSTLFDPATKSMVNHCSAESEELIFRAVNAIMVNRKTSAVPVREISSDFSASAIEVMSSTSTNFSVPVTVSKKMKLVKKHMQVMSQNDEDDNRIRQEIRNYLRYEPGDNDDDPLHFWKRELFPSLQECAKKYLTRSASSVPVESLFSTMGLLLNGKRSTMSPIRANHMSFIHDNFDLYFDGAHS